MGLGGFVARRLSFLLVLMLGATVVTFVVAHLVPGDPVAVNLGQSAMSDPEIVKAYREKYGLDRPLPEQYLAYLRNLVRGDLGRSIRSGRPVREELGRFWPASFELATLATAFAVSAGVVFGTLSARWRGRWFDSVVRAVSVIGVSVPNFWLALVALYLLYFRLAVFPGPGRIDTYLTLPDGTGFLLLDGLVAGDWALWLNSVHHLILPALVLAAFTTGVVTRTTRSSLLEVLAQDFVRTARAKGLAERRVLARHALGNALIPTVTIIGLSYGNLLGGTVLVETIFAWPGVGRYAYQATTTLDFPAIMGVALILTLVYVLVNFTVDVLYAFLDPRIRYQ
jgi:peptide/nickel transport system permease protein